MAWTLFRCPGFYDIVAVGGGRSFNPGSPGLAQELVDVGVVRDVKGGRIAPGTYYVEASAVVSIELWSKIAGHEPTSRSAG